MPDQQVVTSKGFISEQYLYDIADAIRSKLSSSSTYLPSEMAQAILSIEGGDVTAMTNPEIDAAVAAGWNSTV